MKISNLSTDHPLAIIRGWVDGLSTSGAGTGAVVQMLTNNLGTTLNAGDVVVIDSGGITTTTTPQDTRPVGIVQDTILGFGIGPVLTQGFASYVHVTASVTANEYAETSSVAAEATQNATRRAGSFAIYLTGGTTPTALMLGGGNGGIDLATIIASGDFVLTYNGGDERENNLGSFTGTKTVDISAGNYQYGTMTGATTFTFTGATAGKADSFVLELSGAFLPTWPGSVITSDTDPATGTRLWVFSSRDGGANWYGFLAGAGLASSSFATPAIILGTAAAAGAAATTIRSDATIVAFDATVPAAIGTAATGSQAVAARRDHAHNTGAGTPTTSAIGDAASTGSGPAAAMTDHVHGREALSTATPLVESGSGATGTGTKSSREDHVHPAAASSGSGVAFTIIGQETRTSDGATVVWALDNDFEENSVQAFNLTSGKALTVTETLPNTATIGAAGTAGDVLSFAYAASAI